MSLQNVSVSQWESLTDAEIARDFSCTRQNVSAYRKQHGMPASPAGHGGIRHGTCRMTITLANDQRLAQIRAAKTKKIGWEQWAVEALENAANEQANAPDPT